MHDELLSAIGSPFMSVEDGYQAGEKRLSNGNYERNEREHRNEV